MVASRLLLSFRAYILIPVAQVTMIRAVPALELTLVVLPLLLPSLLSRPCLLLRLPPRAYLSLMRMKCFRVRQLRDNGDVRAGSFVVVVGLLGAACGAGRDL